MYLVGIKVLSLFLVVAIVTASPYPWGMHQSNYDASLDPIVWSRDFVKDSIRRPRQFNTLEGGENVGRIASMKSSPAFGFGRRRSSKPYYVDVTNGRFFESSPRKINPMRKKFYRRRHKLDARDRYGFV